jgi:hypothetical protein
MEHGATRLPGDAPRCTRCDRDALTIDDAGSALCARHATIFLTVARIDAGRRADTEAGERHELTPA